MKSWWKRLKASLALQKWPVLTPKEADKKEQDRLKRYLEHLYSKKW